MSPQENKQCILSYFDAITGKRNDRPIDSYFSRDVTWQVPQSNPMITPNPRRGLAAVMDLLGSGVNIYAPGSLSIDLQRLIADDEHVVAQFTFNAKLANGHDYCNQYCFVFALNKEGKISGVWEYLDTLYQWNQGAFTNDGQ